MKSSLDMLRELTPRLADLALPSHKADYIEYDVDGSVFGFSLFTKPSVSVMRAFLSKGSVVPEHSHEEREWMLVFEGCMIFRYGEQERTCHVGDWVFFDTDEPHSAEMLEDTWMIAVTIPAGGGYPGVPGNPSNPHNPEPSATEGFMAWINHLLKVLDGNVAEHKEMRQRTSEIAETLTKIRVELSALKVKSGVWGVIGGAIPVVVSLIVAILLGLFK